MIIPCPFTVSRNAKVLISIMLSDYAYLCYWTDLEFGWRFQDFFCFSNGVDSVRLWQCRPRMTFVSRLLKFAPSKSVLKHLTIQNDHFRVTYRVLLYIILIKLQTKNYHNDNKLPGRVIFLVIVRILRLVHTCSVTCVQFENIRTCVKKKVLNLN